MNPRQTIVDKSTELYELTRRLLAQDAANLVNEALDLSHDELVRRLDGALQVLRGEDVTAVTKTSLQIGEEMLDSYQFDLWAGASTFTIPAGVSDAKAIKSMEMVYRKIFPDLGFCGVNGDYREYLGFSRDSWYEEVCDLFPKDSQLRSYSDARQITVTAVVADTTLRNKTDQGALLARQSLVFSDPRDQAQGIFTIV